MRLSLFFCVVYAAYVPSCLRTFRDNLSTPSSRVVDCLNLTCICTGADTIGVTIQLIKWYATGNDGCSVSTIPGLANLGHAAFTAVPLILFISFARPASLILCRICLYIHMSDCIQTVYELPLLPINTAVKHFYINWELCEVLTGYLPLGRRPGGDWANTWYWTESFTVFFWNRKQQQPKLLPHFLSLLHSSIRSLLEI
jgi:hypothetical protein